MTPAAPVYVYCLRDPETARVGYVGITEKPPSRFIQHLRDGRSGTSPKARWLQSLGMNQPSLCVLEQVPFEDRLEAERRWIVYWREQGHPVTNDTHQGVGAGDEEPAQVLQDVLTVPEAAALKQVDESTIIRAIKANKLVGENRGRFYLVPRSALALWTPSKRGRKRKQAAE